MKHKWAFWAGVIAILAVSGLMLAGSMYLISTRLEAEKPHKMNSQINNAIIEGYAPMTQAQMAEKFGAMSSVDEETNTITVITEDYPKDFWQSNYEKEVIHSLSQEEVLFLIQDSIRIYETYNAYILPGYDTGLTAQQYRQRIPRLTEQVLHKAPPTYLDFSQRTATICNIIYYRLKALSSPNAFIHGAEAVAVPKGHNKVNYPSGFKQRVFYIPGYCADTPRNRILSSIAFLELANQPGLEFGLFYMDVPVSGKPYYQGCTVLGCEISYIIRSQSSKMFPNPDTEQASRIVLDTEPGEKVTDDCIIIGQTDGSLSFLMKSGLLNSYRSGHVQEEGQKLTLCLNGFPEDFRYVFYRQEDGSYRYTAEESHPMPGYPECETGFPDGKLFYPKKAQ